MDISFSIFSLLWRQPFYTCISNSNL